MWHVETAQVPEEARPRSLQGCVYDDALLLLSAAAPITCNCSYKLVTDHVVSSLDWVTVSISALTDRRFCRQSRALEDSWRRGRRKRRSQHCQSLLSSSVGQRKWGGGRRLPFSGHHPVEVPICATNVEVDLKAMPEATPLPGS